MERMVIKMYKNSATSCMQSENVFLNI